MPENTFPSIPQLSVPPGVGVAMNTPPSSLLQSINKEIKDAVATLPPESKGALVGVTTTEGVNLALVSRVNKKVDVTAWIGKTWGAPVKGGAAVQIHW